MLHARLRTLGADVDDVASPAADGESSAIVRAYIDAHNRGDVAAVIDLLSADVKISMPPEEPCHGRREAAALYAHLLGDDGPGAWPLVPVRVNGAPAVASYLRQPGARRYRALSIDVLRVVDGRIAAIHCFLGASAFPAFGLGMQR